MDLQQDLLSLDPERPNIVESSSWMNSAPAPLGSGSDLIDFNFDDQLIFSSNDKNNGPLSCLKCSTITLLSTLLNPIKIIPSENGIPRDWRGLAELLGINSETMIFLEGKPNPTQELIKLFGRARNSSDFNSNKTVEDLKAFLCLMDRYDVLEDAKTLFDSDVVSYCERLSSANGVVTQVPSIDKTLDKTAVTYDDINSSSLSRFDAFILYSDEDSDFAMEIVEKMEKEYNLKMCLRDRDLLPGVMFENEVIGKLIEERCNRLLVIFSPSFIQSPANQFLVSYTQALAIETRQRKIIPCMYKKCDLPLSVRYSFCLNYTRQGKLWNFWDRLGKSLAPPLVVFNSPQPLPQVTSNLTDFDPVWWDAEKKSGNVHPNTPTHPKSDSGISSLASSSSNFDSISISSESPILPSTKNKDKSSSKKWYKKIVNPSARKKHKTKKTLVPLPE